MVADGLLTRQRYREVPPRVDYELTERARDLLPVIGALSRWGSKWAWSPPRADESIDIGAIFRSIPGLACPVGFDGTAELTVTRRDGQQKHYVLSGDRGEMRMQEGAADDADTRISGPERAWIEALGPEASRHEIEVDGDRRLADALLDGLAPLAVREAAVA
jgi:hypothetical protein